MNNKPKKLPLIIGIGICAVAAIAFFFAYVNVRNESKIMVAKDNLAAFTYVTADDVEAVGVPKASITDNDLTEDEWKEDYNEKFTITRPFLANQRIDQRNIPSDEETSFGVVLPDERVIAVTSTVAGISGGLITAGDVVDVQISSSSATGGNNTTASEFAKVLCVAASADDCQGVIPDGVNVPSDEENSGTNSDGNMMVVLAAEEGEAASIAGQAVNLALNPFCQVGSDGYFISPRQGQAFACNAGDRLAAKAPAEDAPADEDTTSETADEAATG